MTPTRRGSVGRDYFLPRPPAEGADGEASRLSSNRTMDHRKQLGIGDSRLSAGRIERMDISPLYAGGPHQHSGVGFPAKELS